VLARTLAQYGASDPEHLPDIEKTPDVQKANADLVQAKQAFDRATELFKRTLISQQTLDDAKAALQSKQASYDSALQNAKNLRASIQASEATMKLAGRQLRDTEIRAPFDGYVEKRLVNLGELVKTQMPVMAVMRLDPLKVIAEIPEKMAPWIKDGQPVALQVDAYRGRTFAGKVSRISPGVNASTRAFPFEALVPNTDTVLKPGTFARVHIESGQVDEVLTLPYSALQYRYGVNRVFVVGGDKLSMRELGVGERMGDRIEIVSGVKAGERVAVTDVDTLADGAPVVVTKQP
jgi:RND family efflux transporter MFP subunit